MHVKKENKPASNILTGERMNAFLLKSVKGCPLLQLLISIVLKDLVKHIGKKKKINEVDFLKLLITCVPRDSINKIKRQLTEWEKISPKPLSAKD